MPDRFVARRYEAGDEDRINELYRAVTGRERTREQWHWQWSDGPAGPADVFLIERIEESGRASLVGHHGIMPLRFTRGNERLVFGKTENTMVLPEYRSAFIYPRFEQGFLAEYQSRYHALFSTLGPAAAIRMRKAMGYSYPVDWRSYLVGTSIRSEFAVLSLYARAVVPRTRIGEDARSDLLDETERKLLAAGFLEADTARANATIRHICSEARSRRTIQPGRGPDDMDWRFWNNPHKRYFAWIEPRKGAGFAVLSVNFTVNDAVAFLDDYVVVDPGGTPRFIDQLLEGLRSAGLSYLRVLSTTDSDLSNANRHFEKRSVAAEKARGKWAAAPQPGPMPRKVTPRGSDVDLEIAPWEITAMVLEGTTVQATT